MSSLPGSRSREREGAADDANTLAGCGGALFLAGAHLWCRGVGARAQERFVLTAVLAVKS